MKASAGFLGVFYLLLFVPFCSAYFVDVGFTIGDIGDKNLCKGGGANYNTGIVELALRRGHSCAEGTQGFDDLYCINPNRDDLMFSLQSGQSASIHCEVGTNPFKKNGDNCIRVTWCDQADYGDYKDISQLCKDLNGECDKPGPRKIKGAADCPDTCYEILLKVMSADEPKAVLEAGLEGEVKDLEVSAMVGETVFFDVSKSKKGDNWNSVQWFLKYSEDDEGTASETGLSADQLKHVYDQPGRYKASLRLTGTGPDCPHEGGFCFLYSTPVAIYVRQEGSPVGSTPVSRPGSKPAVIAVGGAGSTAASTQQSFCPYFENVGWICIALDAGGGGEI